MKVAIIGAGASGVLAALRIKVNNPNIDVHLFEKNKEILKKVLSTGNGRCNLGNINIDADNFSNKNLILNMFDLGYKDESLKFLKELGIFYYHDFMGRVYPKSNQASSVVELLTKKIFYYGINVILNKQIMKITKIDNKFLVDNEEYDYVILSTGSNAQISNEAINLSLISSLKHTNTLLTPALVGFKVNEKIKNLAGVKALCNVKYNNHSSSGEMIFKEDGISGICVMDLSLFYNPLVNDIYFDFIPEYSCDELLMNIKNRLKCDDKLHLHNVFVSAVNKKLLNHINTTFKNELVSSLNENELLGYIKKFKEFRLTIYDTYSFMQAQIVNGGVNLDEVSMFKSKKIKNLYLTGEVLDEGGICGGNNLWFAFTSGIIVADRICEVINYEG